MALIGPRDGAPLVPKRDYCARIAELACGVEAFSRAAGMAVEIDENLVTERAAFLGLRRGGTISANGKCRMVRASDGWLAVNLPRDDDIELIPAWLGCEAGDDIWQTIEQAARAAPCARLAENAQLLGLAVARVGDSFAPPPFIVPMGAPGARRKERPLVLDMSSLWAGPLCGALLAEAGADVVKLESPSRPDGARFGDPSFFAKLNANKRMLALDLPQDRDTLRKLFAAADIVIESARPRVLAQWGFKLSDIFEANPYLIWISVTAYGRKSARANWVGFGDDVAAAAGLVVETTEAVPIFVGDAIADPLTGLAAAASAFAGLAAGGGFLIDASLFAAAAYVAAAPPLEDAATVEWHDGAWLLHSDGWFEPVRAPAANPVPDKVKALGADSKAVLREILP